MSKDETHVTTVRLPVALRDQLAALAEADRRSINAYIVLALERHVEAAAVAAAAGAKGGGKGRR